MLLLEFHPLFVRLMRFKTKYIKPGNQGLSSDGLSYSFMEATLALSTRDSQPEVSSTCSITDMNSTASNLTGPGRALGKVYSYLGRHVELLLDKVVVVTGRRPAVIAERIIRHHEDILSITSAHDIDGRCLKYPLLLEGSPNDGEDVVISAIALRRLEKKIREDSRRLVDSTNSSSPFIQQQAAESIHRLSVWSDELRAVLRSHCARQAVSRLIELNETFRFKDRRTSDALLSSSRKALVSLDDVTFHSVLKEWIGVTGRGWLPENVARPIWNKISAYLSSSDKAFVALRTLRRSSTNVLGEHLPVLTPFVLRTIRDSPGYFEWSECEEVICLCFSWGYESLVLSWLELISDWLFQNVQNMPRVLEEPRIKVLEQNVFQMKPADFVFFHRLLHAIVKGIRSVVRQDLSADLLQARYTHVEPPLLDPFTCPLTNAVASFVNKHQFFYRQTPCPRERSLYEQLICYIDKPDPTMVARAWAYIKYFQRHDIHRCNMLLGLLSRSTLATRNDISSIFTYMKRNCLPAVAEDHEYVRYYRHTESEGTVHYHIYQSSDCPWDNPSQIRVMEVPCHWVLRAEVARGGPVSRDMYQPLVVEYDESGKPAYLVEIPVGRIPGYSGHSSARILIAVRDGTKPEDLRIEISSSNQTVSVAPEKFDVPVLRYAPESYAKILGVEEEDLFLSGPLSWKPVEQEKAEDGDDGGDYDYDSDEECSSQCSSVRERCSVRVVTIEEALAHGYSREQVPDVGTSHVTEDQDEVNQDILDDIDNGPAEGDIGGPQQSESKESRNGVHYADREVAPGSIGESMIQSDDQGITVVPRMPQDDGYRLQDGLPEMASDGACCSAATQTHEPAKISQSCGTEEGHSHTSSSVQTQDKKETASDSGIVLLNMATAFAFGLFLGSYLSRK